METMKTTKRNKQKHEKQTKQNMGNDNKRTKQLGYEVKGNMYDTCTKETRQTNNETNNATASRCVRWLVVGMRDTKLF